MSKINSIFLIDDDCDDREIFQTVLSDIDRTIDLQTACDGVEALERLKEENTYDLIFLDINMPRMDGIETLKHLKKNPKLKQIPVIIYSTTNQENFINKTLSLGAILYLPKSNSFEELQESLKKIINSDNF